MAIFCDARTVHRTCTYVEATKSLKITHILISGFILIYRESVQSVYAQVTRDEGGIPLTRPKLIPLHRPLKRSSRLVLRDVEYFLRGIRNARANKCEPFQDNETIMLR
ncbi:hypothetical protein QTP88_024389 [Uroleucon formosanum]